MIVVLLIVIWGIALVPVTMRWLSQRQLTTSVARFMSARRNLRRSYPLLAVVGSEGRLEVRPERPRPTAPNDAVARLRRERAQLRVERRRRMMSILCGGTGITIAFGALPPLHKLWDLSVVGIVLTAAYCALLVHIARNEAATVRRRPVVPATQARYEAAGLLVANGQVQAVAPRLPQRPAFVLVDAPS